MSESRSEITCLVRKLVSSQASSRELEEAVLLLRDLPAGDPRETLVFQSLLTAVLRTGLIGLEVSNNLLRLAEERRGLLREPSAEQFELLLRRANKTSDAERLRAVRIRQAEPSPREAVDPFEKLDSLVKSAAWLFAPDADRSAALESVVLEIRRSLDNSDTQLPLASVETLFFACTSYSAMLSESARVSLGLAIRKRLELRQELLCHAMRSLYDFDSQRQWPWPADAR